MFLHTKHTIRPAQLKTGRQIRGHMDQVTHCSAALASRDCVRGRAAVSEFSNFRSTFSLEETFINPKSEIAAQTGVGSHTGGVS